MTLIAKFTWQEKEGTLPNQIEWKIGDGVETLENIFHYAHSCWEIYVDGDDFCHLLKYTLLLPNPIYPDEKMYFVGDFAKMVARNIKFLFQE